MELKTIAAASFENQKFFLDPACSALPIEIKDEIKVLCVSMAQKLCCTFTMNFDEFGDVYFQTFPQQDAFAFDDIGADLEIKRIRKSKCQLLLGLQEWYMQKDTV